jgi:predicted nucleic acid-binding protein
MSGWLLETHVATRLASQFQPEIKHPDFIASLQQQSDSIYFSAIFISQITDLAGELRRHGKPNESLAMLDWLEKLVDLYGLRFLPIDAKVAKVSGEIICELKETNPKIYINTNHLFIAATARAHDLVLLTTEPKSYELMKGFTCADPFDPANYEAVA